MLDKNITMDDVNFALKHYHQEDIRCIYSDYNDDNLILRIRPNMLNKENQKESLDQMDDIYLIKSFQDQILQNIILRGTKYPKGYFKQGVIYVLKTTIRGLRMGIRYGWD